MIGYLRQAPEEASRHLLSQYGESDSAIRESIVEVVESLESKGRLCLTDLEIIGETAAELAHRLQRISQTSRASSKAESDDAVREDWLDSLRKEGVLAHDILTQLSRRDRGRQKSQH